MENWEKRYDEMIEKFEGKTVRVTKENGLVKQFISSELELAKQEERERISSWFNIPLRKGIKPIIVPPGLVKNKPEGGLIKPKGCEVCGGRLVYIRSQYPGGKRRKVCPTCAIEILERLKSNLNIDAGKTDSPHQNNNEQGGK